MTDQTTSIATCPQCGSAEVSGEMASFYVPLTDEGDMDGEWLDYESCTELTDNRSCQKCGHMWDESNPTADEDDPIPDGCTDEETKTTQYRTAARTKNCNRWQTSISRASRIRERGMEAKYWFDSNTGEVCETPFYIGNMPRGWIPCDRIAYLRARIMRDADELRFLGVPEAIPTTAEQPE